MAKKYGKGDVLSVKVQRVVDGDTVRVLRTGFWQSLFSGDPIVVRLYGMDAPESEQKFGKESTNELLKMLRPRRGLKLEVQDYDRYDRLVGLLYYRSAGRTKSLNFFMVEKGWAHAYTRYGGSDLGFEEAEGRAKSKKLGIWKRDTEKELPEDWRRRKRDRSALVGKVKLRMAVVGGVLLVMVVLSLWMWLT